MKNIRLLIAFALLCFAGMTGILPWSKQETYAGYFTVSANPYGVAIYQEGPHASVQFGKTKSFRVQNNAISLTPEPNQNITVNYNRNDIIIDGQGMIYTEPTQEQIDYLTKTLSMSLQKIINTQRTIPLSNTTLYLINPTIPGMLQIDNDGNSQIYLNRDDKTLIIEKPTNILVKAHDLIKL